MSEKVEDWKAITPGALVVPVEHVRKTFDLGVWKCSEVTRKLCFADLHPDERQVGLEAYRSAFLTYRGIIGIQAARQFDNDHRTGTPAAIFHAYLEAFSAGLDSNIRGSFADLLEIGLAHSARLGMGPVDWAKTHLSILINDNKHMVTLWIKSVCDKQDYSRPLNTDEETDDFILWRYWRAPKLIRMQPSGSVPFNASTAWDREGGETTEKWLEGLSGRFIQFLGFHLEKIAGDAHVELAKTGSRAVDDDRPFELMAIEEARKSVAEDERPHPKVGAVVVKNEEVLSRAHRGEVPKSHAEYVALEQKLSDELAAGATVYTTLEPCTTRKHPKIPCAQRLVDRKVARVVIGMLDPNPDIRGLGVQLLNESGIETQLFPRDLTAQVEEINREFIRAQKEKRARPRAGDGTARAAEPSFGQGAEESVIPFEEVRPTYNSAAYFGQREGLAPHGYICSYPDQNLCYLRLIPKTALATPMDLATLKEAILAAPLLRDGSYASVTHGLNGYGAITCTFTGSKLTASTQVFQNGETWCVSSSLIRTERDGVPEYLLLPFVSVFVLEHTYYRTLHGLVTFATKKLSLKPPWEVELGLVGVSGLYLNSGHDPLGPQLGPIYKTEIVFRSSVGDSRPEALNEVLLSFFSKVFDSVGERRPANLNGFPPSRPTASGE